MSALRQNDQLLGKLLFRDGHPAGLPIHPVGLPLESLRKPWPNHRILIVFYSVPNGHYTGDMKLCNYRR